MTHSYSDWLSSEQQATQQQGGQHSWGQSLAQPAQPEASPFSETSSYNASWAFYFNRVGVDGYDGFSGGGSNNNNNNNNNNNG
ncbi:hypothetical protein [Corynebacterium sp. H78]|uniref:hypothetical protein n=1 Tax=Corynebacterium sp. H78 TaxID=3133417 RepID=UPI0030B584A4